MHFIIGTAGHVDHGKTTLIHALTGIETDRLREEKERGLSIVPGFAHLTLPDNRIVGIVDVPGHERFLKNMLTGASGVDIALLVIAADEGVMPQTIEHLHVLELLQIKRGIIVLTKIDAVDADWLALAREDVRTRLDNTFLQNAPLAEVAAARGDGLDDLKVQIARLCDEVEREESADNVLGEANKPFRLAVDRAFSVSGFGTVVTGSASSGTLAIGESVEVWRPDANTPLTARVRGIEVHGGPVERAERGQRTAINLVGIDLNETLRGGTVCSPGTLAAINIVDVWLQIMADAPRDLKDDATVRAHLGTVEVEARVLLFEGARLNRGEENYARLRLKTPLVCARGDRFVLREVATEHVIGGGLVLDTDVPRSRATARENLPLRRDALESGSVVDLAALVLQRSGPAGQTEKQLCHALRLLSVAGVLRTLKERELVWSGGGLLLHANIATELKHQIGAELRAFHKREPMETGMPRETLRAALPRALSQWAFDALLEDLTAAQQIVVETSGVHLASHRIELNTEELKLQHELLATAYTAAWQPLTMDELVASFKEQAVARKLCYAHIKSGKLVKVGDFLLSAQRAEEGATLLSEHIERNKALTVGEARELLQTSRKWAVPLLEYYDRSGLTVRDGEVRVLRARN